MHNSIVILITFLCTVKCYQVVEKGQKYSEDILNEYKAYLKTDSNILLSSWHDIPLWNSEINQTLNMIVEIPRFSQAKFEISRDKKLNPIVQDKKDQKPRYLPNVFPWHGHVCNYGALPQTWENPFHTDPWTNLNGDSDPIDICEIGTKPHQTGSVIQVKVLGILGLLDSSETDWKVIAIDAKEAEAKNISTMKDLITVFPNLLETVKLFFTVYKVPSGKPENEFAFDGEFQDADFAMEVIKFTHEHWKDMMNNCSISKDFSTVNTLQGKMCSISQEEAKQEIDSQPPFNPNPAPLPPDVDTWSYVQRNSINVMRVDYFFISISIPYILNL